MLIGIFGADNSADMQTSFMSKCAATNIGSLRIHRTIQYFGHMMADRS